MLNLPEVDRQKQIIIIQRTLGALSSQVSGLIIANLDPSPVDADSTHDTPPDNAPSTDWGNIYGENL